MEKEPVVIFTIANVNLYIPIDNLSTIYKHYKTYTNLCSTVKDTLKAWCNLSTASNLQHESIEEVLPDKRDRLVQ